MCNYGYLLFHLKPNFWGPLMMRKQQLLKISELADFKDEELSKGNSGQLDDKKRRVRRSASEIDRHYQCQV